jgi:hypothetical protein
VVGADVSRRPAPREWHRFETPAGDERCAAGAHKSLKKLFCPQPS